MSGMYMVHVPCVSVFIALVKCLGVSVYVEFVFLDVLG
jgi:hypothetical protein